MERLAQELLGMHGEFLKKEAKKTLERRKKQFKVVDGIVRWKSNNRVPFKEMLEIFVLDTAINAKQFADSNAKREEEAREELAKMRRAKLTEEEMFELNSMHERGTKIVDAMTGEVVYVTQ